MTPIPPCPRHGPLRSPRPERRLVVVAVAILALAAMLGGCRVTEPSPDPLLVAAGGPLQAIDDAANLTPFDGPADAVAVVTASGGRVVVATADGQILTASGSAAPRAWRRLELPIGRGAGPPLLALSPLATDLAVLVGDPQGEAFDLLILDIEAGTFRSIMIPRGLNGPPAWIGSASIAIDVIGRGGESEIATVDVGAGRITDETVAARIVAATGDGRIVAVDDPTGDVLVGGAGAWRSGSLEAMTRLAGPTGLGVAGIALSSDGRRLAIVRTGDSGVGSIELLRATEPGWASVRTLNLTGDAPVSIAWLR